MAKEPGKLLELKNIKKSFTQPDGTKLDVLDIPRFEADAGEQVVIMGKSGCGKSTLLHLIAGISRPDSGRVMIGGWDIALFDEHECDSFRARTIGYVFQTFNLLAGFSALENVLLGMTFGPKRAVDRSRAKGLLDRVGLSHRITHKPTMLSVGEQQRVAVARALANRPKLILADEPTANVDTGHQQQIVDLLRDTCREENVALLIVTHSPEVAEQFERVEPLEQLNEVVVH
jgi:putative ABC transport system ATP-binding protein